jgi:hypothetical protein
MATDAQISANPGATGRPHRGDSGARPSGSDRQAVALFGIAGFLVVLARLARQMPAANYGGSDPVSVLREIYRTTVVETIIGGSGPAGASVTRSSSSSGSSAMAAASTTRTF